MRIGRIGGPGGAPPSFCDVQDDEVDLLDGDPFAGPTRAAGRLPLQGAQLLVPVVPTKVLVVLGAFVASDTPRLAAKLPSSLQASGSPVVVPAWVTSPVTVEPELAVVIGRRVKDASPDVAAGAIFGYTCFNDVTVLDYLRRDGDYLRAKSLDTFGPVGPVVVSDLTEQDVEAGIGIRAVVNGRVVHEGNTRRFVHPVREVVSAASRICTLEPGDVISLGTPPGPAEVRPGDDVVVEVEGVGRLRSTVEQG